MKKFFIVAGLVPLIAILGAVLVEYVLKIGVLGTDKLNYFLIAAGLAAVLMLAVSKFLNPDKKFSTAYGASLAISSAIGVMLIPYFVFALGQIDIYMVDDNLAKGITVLEVRPTMDKILFGSANGEVAVWSGPQTLKLHPGANRVKLGRFDMPKGVYKGGTVYIGDIQVDIQADLAQLAGADNQSVPTDKYEEAFANMKAQMAGAVKIVSASLSGNIASITISVGAMTQNLPIPEINYPGMGGPDITLDIVLGPDGRPDPSQIKAIVEMPPGVGGAFPQMPGVEFK